MGWQCWYERVVTGSKPVVSPPITHTPTTPAPITHTPIHHSSGHHIAHHVRRSSHHASSAGSVTWKKVCIWTGALGGTGGLGAIGGDQLYRRFGPGNDIGTPKPGDTILPCDCGYHGPGFGFPGYPPYHKPVYDPCVDNKSILVDSPIWYSLGCDLHHPKHDVPEPSSFIIFVVAILVTILLYTTRRFTHP